VSPLWREKMKAVFLMLVVGVAVIPAAFGLKCYFCLADKPGTTRLGLEGGASVRAMQSRTFSFKKCRDLKKGDDGYDCDLLKNAEDYKDVKEWVCVYFSPRGRGASGCLPKESKTSGCITAGTEKGCFCNTDLCNFDEEGGNGNVDKDKNKKTRTTRMKAITRPLQSWDRRLDSGSSWGCSTWFVNSSSLGMEALLSSKDLAGWMSVFHIPLSKFKTCLNSNL